MKSRTSILKRAGINFADITFFDLKKSRTFRFSDTVEYFKIEARNDQSVFFYPPFFDHTWLYTICNDTSSNTKLYDSSYDGQKLKVLYHHERYEINLGKFEENIKKYVFSVLDSLPIYYLDIYENSGRVQFQEYKLLDYKLNCYDSTIFFKIMADSIKALEKKYPEKVDLDSLEDYNRKHPRKSKVTAEVAHYFYLPSFGGDTISLWQSLENNKLILLDFWYNSCIPCQQAIPKLEALYKKYHNRGLEILGLNPFDSNKLSTQKTIDRHGITYPILLANQSIASQYGVHSYPTLFLIDKNKRVIFSQDGYSEDLETRLGDIIEKHLQ